MPAAPWAWAATFMRRHVRLVGDRPHLREGQLLLAPALSRREHAAGGADLDHLGAVLAQPAHLLAALVRAVDDRLALLAFIEAGGKKVLSQWPPVAPSA